MHKKIEINELVQKDQLSKLTNYINGAVDIFICSSSFEERSTSIASIIDANKITKALIATNSKPENLVGKNTEYLRQRFEAKSTVIALDINDPIKTGDEIKNAFEQIKSANPLRYLIDITTFTHESLLILIKLLSSCLKDSDTAHCVYVGAKDYSIDDKDEDKWLSKGIADIRSVLGYPGEMNPSKPTHLIVIVGFEYERAAALIREIEPHIISLGYGKSGTESDPRHASPNMHFHKLLERIASTYGEAPNFEFSCTSHIDTKDALIKCANKFSDHNVIIVPMNTKISTVGAALVALEKEQIQLCYAQPMHYNYNRYSIPNENFYLFDIGKLLDAKK
jgi:hypothetical protein